jgi:predicted GNAT family acetyltransferase
MTLTDKTGAPVAVTEEADRFRVGVEGQDVGFVEFIERDGRRVFTHTEVDESFGGRGLATILIGEALSATRAAGRRIVAVCPMVASYVDKHQEYADVADPVTPEIEKWLES